MSFVFYDTETTGTHTSFDQILQFGAIRTDANLNELERFEIRCRLDSHVVPSAGALRVTGMTVDQITNPELPTHYEMVCSIRDRLSGWCPATFVGWNTMRFDEQLLRQAFYKCLHPPYLTNTQGNQRSDILKLAQCVEAFAPGILNVPDDDRGKPTYKLDRLAPANGFPHLNAHDAMADVEATIFICRLIRERAPRACEQLLHCASKARVQSVISDNLVFLLRDSYFGRLYEYALTEVGDEIGGMGAVIAYDLAIEPEQLRGMDDRC
ncbi:MAG: exonuclease domain-containing protein [Sphingomicrobium sp.]